ncbi:MAG: phosphotransferase [Dongiaceae bacterium]
MPRTDNLAPILDRIPALAGRRFDGRAVARLASLTNRTYRIGLGTDAFVLRIAGEGTERYIDRAAEAHNAGLAASIGIAPEVVFADARNGVMVTRFIADGMALTPKRLRQRGMLQRAVALLRRLHDSGLPFSGRMDLLPKLDEYVSLASKRRWPGDLDPGAIARHADAARAALERNRGSQVPSHIDPVPDNFVAAGDGSTLYLLDWEYSAMCEPMWDLAALSIEAGLHARQDDILLAAYFPTVTAAESRRFVLYKGMLNLMAAAWALVQVADGNPNADFAAFARDRLARHRAIAESTTYRACIAAA